MNEAISNIDQAIGYVATTLSTIALLPQIHRIWVTRSAKDISFSMLALLLISSIIQLIYGVLIEKTPIILTNCISISIRSMVLGFKIYADWRASHKA